MFDLGRWIFRELGVALVWALLLIAHPAAAQTVTNTARASWVVGNEDQTTLSNTVTFDVIRRDYVIDTFRPTAEGDIRIDYIPSLCGGEPVHLPSSDLEGTSAVTDHTVSYRAGENIVFRLFNTAANRNPDFADQLRAQITSTSGDRENITIFETGENTDVFVGALPTHRVPPSFAIGDCRLGADDGDQAIIAIFADGGDNALATTRVELVADPQSMVFDSENGVPVSGATVSLVDAVTGQPAIVLGPDGSTPWPSSIVSGRSITDAAGTSYELDSGEFWFPTIPPGNYRLDVQPPAPYTAPSRRDPDELSSLRRPDNDPFVIMSGSYGETFNIDDRSAFQVDIPLDAPNVPVTLEKAISRDQAVPGDVVFYTVTVRNQDRSRAKRGVTVVDTPSPWLRLRPDTIRIDGIESADRVSVDRDGRTFTVLLDEIAAAGFAKITYAMSVRSDAPAGHAENRVAASDALGESVTTAANLQIKRDTIGQRMTIIGRVTEGTCTLHESRVGVPGVRIMLEDGSFAVTDADGRYHFEGVRPGTHVVQAQDQTLVEGGNFVDCIRSARNAGTPNSRFVTGQGGSLVVADFYADLPEDWTPMVNMPGSEILDDAAAAGAEVDWFALGDGPAEFLFPNVGYNPRAPAVRAVVRHAPEQSVELFVDGKAVGPLAFDGAKLSSDGSFAVSIWRGIPLDGESTELRAVVRDQAGTTTEEFSRKVDYAAGPVRAEILPEESTLIADGANRPVVAVKLIDRRGLPVRAGVSGTVSVNAPYESAEVLDRLQVEQLASPLGGTPTWTVRGDRGVALIELAPTLVSGPLRLRFDFTDREMTRTQEIEDWIVPGDQNWTIVGLAEGTLGSRSVADEMQSNGKFDSDLGDDARVAFYARGKVLGSVLLTVAYDSAGDEDERDLLGFIDPDAYYTVFADRSSRRFDAASRDKLYVRIETGTFYAIYGDVLTGFDQTELARYDRAVTGFRAEGRLGEVHFQGFAAQTNTRFRRDEIQGGGISGPYQLSTRAIIPNSERVTIEVRDRFRSELVVDSRDLVRFVDYDIDLPSGTITFAQPVLSRDSGLNPQFIVVEYEADVLSSTGRWNGGARGDITLANGAVRLGTSAITDGDDDDRTRILGADARVRLGATTEIRAEIAASRRAENTSTAWLVEAEHRTGDLDLIAYAHSIDDFYGTGQQSIAERGRRKIGVDGRYRVNEDLSFDGSVWRDESLIDDRRRDAVRLQGQYRSEGSDYRLGISHFSDRLADLTTADSTVLEGGVTQRLLANRLELGVTSSVPLDDAESVDLPARHRIDARYALTQDIRAIGTYEIAEGDNLDARTVRVGLETSPWAGARLTGSVGRQEITELGRRSFAAFGLSQSVPLSPSLTVSASLDGNKTLASDAHEFIVNDAQPVASGGHLGQNGEQFEDFTAMTAGAAWRKDLWSATIRGEFRDGEYAERYGVTGAAIRQIGEGKVLGGGITWTRAEGDFGTTTEIIDGAISLAHRPDQSEFAFLSKIEYRSDQIRNAVLGETSPAGQTALLVDGNAASRRLIASLSTNWSPLALTRVQGSNDQSSERLAQRHEIGIFIGGRYNFDRFESIELDGFSGILGLDGRYGIGERIEVGVAATVRRAFTDKTTDFAVGPFIGLVPTTDVVLTVGYNLSGYRDRDFNGARETNQGLFASVRAKFDASSFSFLGIGR